MWAIPHVTYSWVISFINWEENQKKLNWVHSIFFNLISSWIFFFYHYHQYSRTSMEFKILWLIDIFILFNFGYKSNLIFMKNNYYTKVFLVLVSYKKLIYIWAKKSLINIIKGPRSGQAKDIVNVQNLYGKAHIYL